VLEEPLDALIPLCYDKGNGMVNNIDDFVHVVGPRPSFEETLVGFDHFCTSIVWSKMERPGRDEIAGFHLFCGPNKGFTRVFGY
jgi:hypothetical protein